MYFFYVPGISGNLGIGFPHSEPFQARVRFPQCLFGHRDPAFVWGFVANLLLLPGFCLVWFYPAFCLGFRSSYFATAGILFGFAYFGGVHFDTHVQVIILLNTCFGHTIYKLALVYGLSWYV